MIPFVDTAPRARWPTCVLLVIAANLLAFLWLRGLPPWAAEAALAKFALIPVTFTAPRAAMRLGLQAGSLTPLLTNLFLHSGWLHLIGNMWFLWIFGPAMEARMGRLGFAVLFCGGGLAANLLHILSHPASAEPMIGASGAVAAVIAAYAVIYPGARVLTLIPIGFIPFVWPISSLIFAGLWFALQVFRGFAELAIPGAGADVAWWAHIGGFLFGAAMAVLVKATGAGLKTSTTIWEDKRGRHVPRIRAGTR